VSGRGRSSQDVESLSSVVVVVIQEEGPGEEGESPGADDDLESAIQGLRGRGSTLLKGKKAAEGGGDATPVPAPTNPDRGPTNPGRGTERGRPPVEIPPVRGSTRRSGSSFVSTVFRTVGPAVPR
jgi:hypothetical protein